MCTFCLSIKIVQILAKSGARSYHMVDQAHLLLQRLNDSSLCDWNNDWKLVTFFIGVCIKFSYLVFLLLAFLG